MLSLVHFHVKTKQGKPVRSYKIMSKSQAGNPCALSAHMLYLEVKLNRSVLFHLYSNFYSEFKPDELAHFRIDSFRKPSWTNRRASTQLPHSEVKPDIPVSFHIKSFFRTMQGKPVRSHTNSPLGVKPDNRYTPHIKSP